MDFISDRALDIHKEYLKDIKLKINVYLKSYPSAVGVGIEKIRKLGIMPTEREALYRLMCDELLHEVYFSSFDASCERSRAIAREYGSEANFLYKLLRESEGASGFIMIYTDRGRVRYYIGDDYSVLMKIKPILAVDLCEHAYIFDYGFDREKYLKYALNSLNLSKI